MSLTHQVYYISYYFFKYYLLAQYWPKIPIVVHH